MTLGEVVHSAPHSAPLCPYTNFSSNKPMTTGTYLVSCPALGEREIVYGSERAADVLYSMHCESNGAYAFAEDWLGHTFMEYGDPVDTQSQQLIFGA